MLRGELNPFFTIHDILIPKDRLDEPVEINKDKAITISKTIFIYCLRVLLFLILGRNLFFLKAVSIYSFLTENITNYLDFYESMVLFIVFVYFYYYILAKFCGLYKKISNIHFLFALLIVIAISYLKYYTSSFVFQFSPTFKIGYTEAESFFAYVILFNFILYTIFYFLSKKFSFFRKIGYFASFEFYKSIYSKIKSKLEKK